MEQIWMIIKYLFLGIFQGFTEPIPISSSGHLVILQDLMNLRIEGLEFEVMVNFGSLIAVLIIYRNDIVRLFRNSIGYLITKDTRQKDDFEFIIYLIIATLPAGVIGILFKDSFDGLKGQTYVVGITLIITGIALWSIRNLRGRKGDGMLTWKDALIIGFAQAVALVPGISRSGATIVAAMLLGTKQETALRFSFLLFIPVSAGTMLLSVGDLLEDDLATLWPSYLVAFLASIVASYFSLKWFMNIMAEGNLKYFAIYCFIVGSLVWYFL
ncbi:undecaprenyl-diphosphate phosphatase [Halobacillus sp. Marseille-P3879]|uniref:undecaprenyl-diphosphate phosphatase n=1 Tax=Halobacillus TaxID=45667 RepID=UPI000C7B90DD|nr:undecaprenyl-diphosphate phosphatase [Halobacillus sp. Marseille-P3879]